MNIHQQHLAALHPGLTSEDEAFDNSIAIPFKAFDEDLAKIEGKYAEYNDDLKAEKTNTDVLLAHDSLIKKLEEITSKPLGEILVEENELTRKVASSLSLHDDDSTRELLNFYQAKSDREELALMTPEEIRAALASYSEKGNPRLLRAMNGLLKPEALVSAPFLESAKRDYIAAKFADEVAAIQGLKEKVAHISKMKQAIPFSINKIAKSRGILIESTLQARRDANNAALRDRPIAEKLRVIKEKGPKGFQAEYK